MATSGVIAGRYRLVEIAGAGGMGIVHRARDERDGRDVAVKLLANHLAADDLSVQRFRREGRLGARLRHPHVVAGFDVGHDSSSVGHYIVTEFVDGDNAHYLVGHRGPLPADEAVAIAAQVCDALSYVHGQGIIHGDVSAANVLVRRSDRTAKLADFGISRQASASAPVAPGGPLRGAPSYLAPEVAHGGEATFRSDLYSLGIVTQRLLTGLPTWRRNEAPPAGARSDLSPAIADAVARATDPDPGRRQPSVEEFRSELAADLPAARPAARSAFGLA